MSEQTDIKIYSLDDLLSIFPFGKTKLQQLLNANALPVIKVGRQYITTPELISSWFKENIGKEIYY